MVNRCTREDLAGEEPVHVIFQIDGLDYCREEPVEDDVHAWADAWCGTLERQHPGKNFTYRIERW